MGGEGGSVHVVSVETEGGEFRVKRPTPLFSGPFADLTGADSMYDVSPDGQGLVLFQGEISTATSGHEHLRLISNWSHELKETFSR